MSGVSRARIWVACLVMFAIGLGIGAAFAAAPDSASTNSNLILVPGSLPPVAPETGSFGKAQKVAITLNDFPAKPNKGVWLTVGAPVVARLVAEEGSLVLYSAAPPANSLQRTVVGPLSSVGAGPMALEITSNGQFRMVIPNRTTVVRLPGDALNSDLRVYSPGSALTGTAVVIQQRWTGQVSNPGLAWLFAVLALASLLVAYIIARRWGFAGSRSISQFGSAHSRRPVLVALVGLVLVALGFGVLAVGVSQLAPSTRAFRSVTGRIANPTGEIFTGAKQSYPNPEFFGSGGKTWSADIRHGLDASFAISVPDGAATILLFGGVVVGIDDSGELFATYAESVYPVRSSVGQVSPGSIHEIRLRLVDNRRMEIWLDGSLTATTLYLNQPVIAVSAVPSLVVAPGIVRDIVYGVSESADFSADNAARFTDGASRVAGLLLTGLGSLLFVFALLRWRIEPPRLRPSVGVTLRPTLWLVSGGAALALLFRVANFQATLPGDSIALSRNWPLFTPAYRFSDFFQTDQLSRGTDPFSLAKSWYPPFGNAMLWPFTALGPRPAFIAFVGISLGLLLGALLWVFRRELRPTGLSVLVIVALSYPIWFAVDRGNTELLVSAVAIVGVVVALYGQAWWGGALLLGMAGAAKIWPVFLLAGWLRGPRAKWVALGAVCGILLASLAASLVFERSPFGLYEAWFGSARTAVRPTVGSTDTVCSSLAARGAFGTSILSMMAAALAIATCSGRERSANAWQEVLTRFVLGGGPLLLSVLVLACLAAVLLFWKARPALAMATMCASSLAVSLPSAEYRAVTLFAIIAALPLLDRLRHPRALGAALGLSLAFMPVWYFGQSPGTIVGIASILTPLALCYLAFVLWREAAIEWRVSRRPKGTVHPGGLSADSVGPTDAAAYAEQAVQAAK